MYELAMVQIYEKHYINTHKQIGIKTPTLIQITVDLFLPYSNVIAIVLENYERTIEKSTL
jgi:hypothetical protein